MQLSTAVSSQCWRGWTCPQYWPQGGRSLLAPVSSLGCSDSKIYPFLCTPLPFVPKGLCPSRSLLLPPVWDILSHGFNAIYILLDSQWGSPAQASPGGSRPTEPTDCWRAPLKHLIGSSSWTGTRLSAWWSPQPALPEAFQWREGNHPSRSSGPNLGVSLVLFLSATAHVPPPRPLTRVAATGSQRSSLSSPLLPSVCEPVKMSIWSSQSSAGNF